VVPLSRFPRKKLVSYLPARPCPSVLASANPPTAIFFPLFHPIIRLLSLHRPKIVFLFPSSTFLFFPYSLLPKVGKGVKSFYENPPFYGGQSPAVLGLGCRLRNSLVSALKSSLLWSRKDFWFLLLFCSALRAVLARSTILSRSRYPILPFHLLWWKSNPPPPFFLFFKILPETLFRASRVLFIVGFLDPATGSFEEDGVFNALSLKTR